MQEQVLKDSLIKILKICCRNGFFNLRSTKNSLKSIQYGPLGSLFMRNIWREWLSSTINNTDVSMFPIEVTEFRNPTKSHLSPVKSSSVISDAFKNYSRLFPLFGIDNPYGFALYGPTEGVCQNEMLLDNSVLRKFEFRHGLFITFFCPTKKSSDWFNYWARYRYRWWRKFSNIASKFYLSDVTETKAGNQQISLMMEFPWGKENLETITLYNGNFIRNNCDIADIYSAKSQAVSSVIVCESELNLAGFAYLSNSFSEKWRDGKVRKLFQLHTKLAPYKVCISVSAEHSDDLKNLKDVAVHLEKELKKCRITVFPCFETSLEDNHLKFRRYDEMGVPYTVVLNKKALNSGIAGLRSRDTTLEEQVHIAELTSKLLKYLQMKSDLEVSSLG